MDELFPRPPTRGNCYNPPVLRIGSIEVVPSLVLAPMAGHTDTFFRQAVKALGGCGLVVSELLSTEGLTRNHERSLELARFHQSERPIAVQIFGSDPSRMAAAAGMVREMGADIVDINAGCPVRKVVSQGGGSDLLRDLPLLEKIFRSVRRAVDIPVTVKIRSGWDRESINAVEVLKLAEDCGLDALTIHARTRCDMFSRPADWSVIARVKDQARIPVIGNGDVFTPQDADRMFRETGVDGVMIGRGMLGNPWLIRECHDYLEGRAAAPASLEQKAAFMLAFLRRVAREFPPPAALGRMKRMGSCLTKGLPGGAHLRRKIHEARACDELLAVIEEFLDCRTARAAGRSPD